MKTDPLKTCSLNHHADIVRLESTYPNTIAYDQLPKDLQCNECVQFVPGSERGLVFVPKLSAFRCISCGCAYVESMGKVEECYCCGSDNLEDGECPDGRFQRCNDCGSDWRYEFC